jgi:hypothetical protein
LSRTPDSDLAGTGRVGERREENRKRRREKHKNEEKGSADKQRVCRKWLYSVRGGTSR